MNDLAVPDTPLTIRGVIKRYGKLTALNGIDLTLEAGRFTALLGPNGAGKSTLFQLLSGLFVPDAGEIRLCGYALKQAPSRALAELGIVFQQPTLDLDLTVEANLRFHARLHGMGRQTTARIDTELERVGLQAQRNTPCRALSGGNRRRVELARALLHEPSLLLMDEPTVGLDPASRELLVSYVHELCTERDLAVLWATHLVDEAERAHQVVVLDQGKIVTQGSPDSLVTSSNADSLEHAFLNLTATTKERTRA